MAKKNARHKPRRLRSKKPGLPPGSVIFDGERKVETATVNCIQFGPEFLKEFPVNSLDSVKAILEDEHVAWLDVVGLHNVELIEQVGTSVGIHPLIKEDIVSTGQRPKVEFYDDYIYIVVKMILFDHESDAGLSIEQVSLVVGDGFVVTFQERPGDVFEPVRERIRTGHGRVRKSGADYLAYAILDIIVDHYFIVLGTYSDLLDDLEDQILDDPAPARQSKLRDHRKELISLRRAVWPVREVVASLERTESPLLSTDVRPFYRDVHDHAVQILDIVESLRDVIGGLMDLYLSSLSNRMNEIMKVLTIFGSIFLPLSFMVGMYGMNFDNMPELHFRYGYPILIACMVAVASGLLVFFKRKDWL